MNGTSAVRSWQVNLGIMVATLTLGVMIWGFGYRLGALTQEVTHLRMTVKESIDIARRERSELRASDAQTRERLSRIEVKVDGLLKKEAHNEPR